MEEIRVVVDQYIPIRDVVYNSLREAILTGRLQPGERILEKHLADKIGVSRTPIRESIRMLEKEGLINLMPRRGATVAAICEKDIHDVLEIRRALEILGAKLACQKATKEDIEKIKNAAEEFEKIHLDSNLSLVAEKDELFHDAIFETARNTKLLKVMDDLRNHIYRFRIEYLKSVKFRKIIAQEHKELLEAISNDEESRASKIAEKHILNQEKAVVDTVVEHKR